ncbi:MAG: hypothetical protein ABIU10_09470 [Sphingomicrobium sp.]
MLTFILASLMIAPPSGSAPQQTASSKDLPTLQCREMGSAGSRSEAIVICRTQAEWQVRDACSGATRYCSPEEKMAMASGLPGRATAFPASEDSRIVCRKLLITGSRLRSTNTCLANSEWRRLYDDTQTEMKELQNTFSKKGPF